MSASLVGSEMCIRDSHCNGSQRRPQDVPTTPTTAPAAPQHERARRRRACLLYTSDAADDM
eukprot:13742551-Alexandrium_andersonii.AAC.1